MNIPEKTKFQIKVTKTVAEKVDAYARALGLSRSAFCALLIGQGMLCYEASQTIIAKPSVEAPECSCTSGLY